MKAKNAMGHALAFPKMMLLLMMAATIFFSCKKESAATATPADNTENITKMLQGNALTGSIVTDSDESNTVLTFNRGSKYIIIEKIPGMPVENVDAIRNAVLITSKYGIIVKDTDKIKYGCLLTTMKKACKSLKQ